MDVFLGSSRNLSGMREAFAALVDSLADVALDSCDEDIAARMWENESYAMERDRSKQAAYDEIVRACDLAFFLVDGHLGDYTLHEYQVASDSLAAHGKPVVTAWVRPFPTPGCSEDEVAEDPFERCDDANTRLLLESARRSEHIEIKWLGGENEVLLDMLEIMAGRLEQIPLLPRNHAIWTGHKLLVPLQGVPATRVDAFCSWLACREGGRQA